MRILLDENLPLKLVAALRAEGHEVQSVVTLRLQGLENGKLYQFAAEEFDICLTRDFGFANNVRQGRAPAGFMYLSQERGCSLSTWRRLAMSSNSATVETAKPSGKLLILVQQDDF